MIRAKKYTKKNKKNNKKTESLTVEIFFYLKDLTTHVFFCIIFIR